ncbi:MAG: glycosyltransferase family 4 protein [Planctomycetaceae bacterium]|nr:glycosyltransferase family 4 protein [Planctomycetaceae bacterium]
MNVLVAHSGKQHAYQHSYSLQQLGVLERFVTSTYYKRDAWPDRWASRIPRLDIELQKRCLNGLDPTRVIRRPLLELPEIWHRNFRGNRAAAEAAMFNRDAKFDRWVARKFATESDLFWGFQGSCLKSLMAAKTAGRIAVCEFATAHVTSAVMILKEECERHPEWAGTISNLHFPDWYRERLEAEPKVADICVAASSFTQRSLMEVGVPLENIRLLPLASDIEQFQFRRRSASGPLNVLFVGGIGQRKGIKYLFEAIERVKSTNVKLKLLGPLPVDETPLRAWNHCFEYLGRTDQEGVVKHMHEADILVLPSVFEGFGLVIVEAMATGMPVIASTHSCAPEVVREGTDGFVLEPDDVDGLTDRITWCAENREQLVQMGVAAHSRAQSFSWDAHRERLARLINSIQQIHA